MNQIRGLYYVESTTYPNFSTLESAGLNTVFHADSQLLQNYSLTKSRVQSTLQALEGTDIDLYIDIEQFIDSNGNYVDPSNTDHINTLITALQQLFSDFPTLKGITFEDFIYPEEFYIPNNATQQANMVNFARTVQTALHTINGNLKLGIATEYTDSKNAIINQIAPYADFLMPEMYEGSIISTIPIAIGNYLQKSGNTPLVIDLITFTTWITTPKTVTQISSDIQDVLQTTLDGSYALYASPTIPSGLIFPSFSESDIITPTGSNLFTVSQANCSTLTGFWARNGDQEETGGVTLDLNNGIEVHCNGQAGVGPDGQGVGLILPISEMSLGSPYFVTLNFILPNNATYEIDYDDANGWKTGDSIVGNGEEQSLTMMITPTTNSGNPSILLIQNGTSQNITAKLKSCLLQKAVVEIPTTQLYLSLALKSGNNIISENSSRWLTLTVLDDNGNVPSDNILERISGTYTITDEVSGTVIVPSTTFTMDTNELNILLSNTTNRILNQTLNREQKRISVSILYGYGLEENKEFVYTVRNLEGIS